jgi:hypothetical protein
MVIPIKKQYAGIWRLSPVILATQEQRSGGLWFKASPSNVFKRPYLKNIQHRKGLGEWFKW